MQLNFGALTITLGLSPILEAWVRDQTTLTNVSLARIEAKLDAATAQEFLHMTALDDKIAQLTTQVSANKDVTASAVLILNGIVAQIQAAVDKAMAAGATASELQAITDLGSTLGASTTTLAAAVAANTPAPVAVP